LGSRFSGVRSGQAAIEELQVDLRGSVQSLRPD